MGGGKPPGVELFFKLSLQKAQNLLIFCVYLQCLFGVHNFFILNYVSGGFESEAIYSGLLEVSNTMAYQKKKWLGKNVRLGDISFAAFVVEILFPQL